MKIKSLHELDVYCNDNNDQPTTCPKCGARTEFENIADDKQQHKCLSCRYEFFLDFDEDEDKITQYARWILRECKDPVEEIEGLIYSLNPEVYKQDIYKELMEEIDEKFKETKN